MARPRDGASRVLGEAAAVPGSGSAPLHIPRLDGPWQPLFRPHEHGYYINDHTLYQDAAGQWRLVGITDKSDGNFSAEKYFIPYQGRYYLSITYNNDSPFWAGILVSFKVWPNRASYNDMLIFQSGNPYDFGVYRGRGRSPSLLTQLQAHAAEYVYHPQRDAWYVTTAGWPWAATLTSGEVAVAPLRWDPVL